MGRCGVAMGETARLCDLGQQVGLPESTGIHGRGERFQVGISSQLVVEAIESPCCTE